MTQPFPYGRRWDLFMIGHCYEVYPTYFSFLIQCSLADLTNPLTRTSSTKTPPYYPSNVLLNPTGVF